MCFLKEASAGPTYPVAISIHLSKASIENFSVLPDDVVVYPGHGGRRHWGEEKISNPFCALSLR